MKKMLLLLVVALLSVMSVAADSGADIEVSLQRTEPFPAEPGQYVDVYLLVSNNVGLAENLQATFQPEFPFTLGPGEEAARFLGNLDALRENYARLKYRVNIAPDAQNKDYNLTVYTTSDDQRAKVKWEFPLTVKATDASITLESYQFTPQEIKPGETADLTLTLKNTGRAFVKDIDVTLDLDDKTLSTIGSGTTKRVDRMDPKETAEVTYKIIVDGSAAVQVLDIPVMLDFRDRLNTDFSTSTNVGLVLKSDPELGVRLDDTSITKKGKTGDVSIQVINSGIVDLRYVTIELMESADYDILSYSNDVYIGNLDSDDFEIADFKIKPHVERPNLAFEVRFKDPYNTDYKESHNLPLRIISAEELGESQGASWHYLLLIIVLGAGAWYYYKKRKRARALRAQQHKHAPRRKKR